mmetsp:Transcript_19040/g.22014  ORF Transcript_19040/g.22014 Transcript_19040/m.22014 type:complete len:83 (+) Transcript_19040:166-414(+)
MIHLLSRAWKEKIIYLNRNERNNRVLDFCILSLSLVSHFVFTSSVLFLIGIQIAVISHVVKNNCKSPFRYNTISFAPSLLSP